MAVGYITVGAIMAVWAAVSYYFLQQHATPPESHSYFWCYGFFFTGLALLIIGITLGRIGRSARIAELPPDAPANPTAEPAVAANGQAGVPQVRTAPPVVPATRK